MPYYYPYPYPIPHYVPVVTTTVTAVSAPIIHQTPGFNPLHGQDPGPAPPGIGNRVAGYVTGLAAIGPSIVGVAPIAVPQPHTSDACANCRNQNSNTIAANAYASSPTPNPEPKPPTTKPKSILKLTPNPAPNPASSFSSPPSFPTRSKSKLKLEPPLNILTHANTNKNANPNPKPGCCQSLKNDCPPVGKRSSESLSGPSGKRVKFWEDRENKGDEGAAIIQDSAISGTDSFGYFLLASEYIQRSLIHERDILNAFSGILHKIYGPRHYFGLLLCNFSRALWWKTVDGKYPSRSKSAVDCLPSWPWSSVAS
ncbi:hypothetical protein BPAE_0135g00120 [Botrytis paeoniae]|uniref:Uncharacterized protein n=1 Tax=Botrytis paeoniae TaxID=278948 RepID=A0A4Z1FKM5_9HELO|nr:hypothetical protein BPAE_0135g00120 [Botrytis paeoniae]